MANEEALVNCYNKGCGQKYDPANNADDACRHHPGVPFFHDAYKGWSCCNKKCTDFTEFLNIKGCVLAKHSNVNPEPEMPKVEEIPNKEIVEVKPIIPSKLERPPLDTPMVQIEPEIAQSLQAQIKNIEQRQKVSQAQNTEILVGTSCKNGGCTYTYKDPSCNKTICLHHYGVPIFHEGLKFWSCCQRKTTDFGDFLKQQGCREGKHVWRREDESDTTINCRWDYHQTGPYVVVSIYAKQYSPSKSIIKLNPIRLYVNLVFPQQDNAQFDLDLELRGIIDVSASNVTMFGTKIEIKLKKAEAANWPRLEEKIIKKQEAPKKETPKAEVLVPKVEAVDLSDL